MSGKKVNVFQVVVKDFLKMRNLPNYLDAGF